MSWRIWKIRKRSNFEKTLFPDFFQIQEKKERVTEKRYLWWKKSSENIYGARSETESAIIEDILNMHKTGSNKGTLLSEILNIIKIGGVIIAQGKEKYQFLLGLINFVNKKIFSFFFYG